MTWGGEVLRVQRGLLGENESWGLLASMMMPEDDLNIDFLHL